MCINTHVIGNLLLCSGLNTVTPYNYNIVLVEIVMLDSVVYVAGISVYTLTTSFVSG